jgi:hypothetical protein
LLLFVTDVEVDLLVWLELESYLGEIHDEQEKQGMLCSKIV